MGWVLWAFFAILAMLAIAGLAFVVSSQRHRRARERRYALATRRLAALGDLPGDLTQAMADPERGDHDAQRTDGIPAETLRSARDVPRHRA